MTISSQSYRLVLDTNLVVAAGTGWLEHEIPSPDGNVHRRVLIRVAQAHTGLYCGKIIGEYLEKLIDLHHPPGRAALFITYLTGSFERVEITTEQAPFRPEDLDDEIFILCAIRWQRRLPRNGRQSSSRSHE